MKEFLIYIEDNPAEQLIMKHAFSDLSNSSCELICFSSGEEFLEFLGCSGKYAQRTHLFGKFLLLIDVNLGNMNGYEVLKSLKCRQKERLSDLTVIMMSTSRRETDIQLANQLGAKDFITKPLDFYEVKKITRDLIMNVMPHQKPLTL